MKVWKYSLIALLAATLTLGIVGCGGGEADTTPPVLELQQQTTGYLDEEYRVKPATAVDETDGEVPVTTSVKAPSGSGVALSDMRFTPHEEGVYTLTFTARDKAGNVATENSSVVVRRRGAAPVITVGEYEDTTEEGAVYTLPEVHAEDAEGELPVSAAVVAPDSSRVELGTANSFLVDYAGTYYIVFTATNSDGVSGQSHITVESAAKSKTVDGIDGEIDSRYETAVSTYVGGLRKLEKIGVRILRSDAGVYFAFDAASDTRVSGAESIKLYFDSEGTADRLTDDAVTLDLRPDGTLLCLRGQNQVSTALTRLRYSQRPVAAVKLGAGTTLAAGNTDDNGYTAEVFVPYALIGVEADESFYLSLGCEREGDTGWDGWNEAGIYPDPKLPHTYVEITPAGEMKSVDRNYVDLEKADGRIDDAKYSTGTAVTTTIPGARGLEGMRVRIARDSEGLYFGYDVSADKNVNPYDRAELFVYLGDDPETTPQNNRSFAFYVLAGGGLQIDPWENGKWTRRNFYVDCPAAATVMRAGTTFGYNEDVDNGWTGELFIPYAFFNRYSNGEVEVNASSSFRLSFGIMRSSAGEHHYGETDSWGDDTTKDWDGWSYGTYIDPLIPTLYPLLLPEGRIANESELDERLPEPSDASVNAKLDEAYWSNAAQLVLPKGADYDGVTALLYRDTNGLRVGFTGDVHELTWRDVVVLYISTKDSSYTIGGESGDAYEVRGQYANKYDWTFQIHFDRTMTVYRGLYKDWADRINDLSSISYAVDLTAPGGYVAELFIPYEFLTTDRGTQDAYAPDKDTTLGVSLRLVGENSRGSLVWNNLHWAGIYCDSEAPASYVRLDKDNKLFAATRNDATYRVDGSFDEALYSGSKATLAAGSSKAELWRSEAGVHVKVTFGSEDAFRLVLSTLDHSAKLNAPYVYDFLVVVTKDGKVEGSHGNSRGFVDPTLYVSYCAPRAVVKDGVAELFISYDWLSRYNTTSNYAEKGYMQITSASELRLAAEWVTGEETTACTYNGTAANFDLEKPDTYQKFVEEGV